MPSNSSFVDANSLTPPQLAALLRRLAANRTEYEQYFLFKRQPLSKGFVQMALDSYVRWMDG